MKIPFSVSSRTAALIGSENFSNPEGAIVELVKNAYDADSSYCFILYGKDEIENDVFYIIDWGIGMTDKTIKNCWMRIGTDDKLVNVFTRSGRVKSGAKGIGRFALNRLGTSAEMLTMTSENGGYKWIVNWSDFDKPNTSVSEVLAELDKIALEEIQSILNSLSQKYKIEFPVFSTGTILKISGLKDQWDSVKIGHLYTSLQDLIPPFNAPSFNICLRSLDSDDYGKVDIIPYDDYDYFVSSHYDGQNNLKVEIHRNELDVDRLKSEYAKLFERDDMKVYPYTFDTFEKGSYVINLPLNTLRVDNPNRLQNYYQDLGAFSFNFYFIKSTKSDNRGEGDDSKYPYRLFVPANRRNWLSRNVGIKIYRDKFRVRPYGENGDDWLHLGDRYASNPIGAGQRRGGYHIRQNQIVGAVEISRLSNLYLQDKSGREGLQENVYVDLFKDILIGIIGLMEKDRNEVMYNLSQLYDTLHPKGLAISGADEAIRSGINTDEAFKKIAEGYQAIKEGIEEKESELRLLRNLASTGLVITSFSHELKNIAILSKTRSEDIRCAMQNVMTEEEVSKLGLSDYDNPYSLITDLRNQDQNIRSWLEFSINSVNRDKRTRKLFSLLEYFTHFHTTWNTVMDELKINLDISGFTEDMRIRAFMIDLDTIFNNLLSNSIYSIKEKKATSNRVVRITGIKDGDHTIISFEDTGIGLSEMYKDHPSDIFNAFETSKHDKDGNKSGTGLGLYIVKSTLAEYKGSSISLILPYDNGFGIQIKLKNYK